MSAAHIPKFLHRFMQSILYLIRINLIANASSFCLQLIIYCSHGFIKEEACVKRPLKKTTKKAFRNLFRKTLRKTLQDAPRLLSEINHKYGIKRNS